MTKKFRIGAALLMPFAVTAVAQTKAPTAPRSPLTLQTQDRTIMECWAASEFIMHAAQSRDYGKSGAEFKQRHGADFLAIRKYLPSLRWFVRGPAHEQFLRAWVNEVFSTQRSPQDIRQETLVRCQGENDYHRQHDWRLNPF